MFSRQQTEEEFKKTRKTDVAVISAAPGGGLWLPEVEMTGEGRAEADGGFHPPPPSS